MPDLLSRTLKDPKIDWTTGDFIIRRTSSGESKLMFGNNSASGGDCIYTFHTDSTVAPYGKASIVRYLGNNSDWNFTNTGSGSLQIINSGGAVKLAGTSVSCDNDVLKEYRATDVAQTGAYTLLDSDNIVRADASAGAFTLTLPAASGRTGKIYTIIRTDQTSSTNALTIDANASETIGGNLTYILWPAETVIIECDGSNWRILEAPEVAAFGYNFNKGTTPNRRYIAGLMSNDTLLTATTGPTVDLLYAMPFPVGRTTKFDTISYELTTQGASSQVRLGLYRDNGNTYPGSLIFDSGNITGTNPAGEKTATITSTLQILQSGLYWLTYVNSATVPLIRCLPGAGSMFPILGHAAAFGANPAAVCYTATHTATTALPSTYPASATLRNTVSAVGSPIPAVSLRAV